MPRRPRNPLEPVASVVGALLWLIVGGLVAGTLGTVLGSGSIMGLGRGGIYLDVPDLVFSPDMPLGRWTPGPGVTVNTAGFRFYLDDPSIAQRLWYSLTLLPSMALFTAALLLAYRLIRGAERGGLYTLATAQRLRRLGWLLLLGAPAATLAQMLAANRLLATLVTNDVDWDGPVRWDFPIALALTATVVLTFARILRVGVGMRDELAGTV